MTPPMALYSRRNQQLDATTHDGKGKINAMDKIDAEPVPAQQSTQTRPCDTAHTLSKEQLAVGASTMASDSKSPKSPTKTTANSSHKPKSRIRKGSFRSRTSPLDYETLEREQNSMRGFFTLFWVFMAIYVVVTAYKNYRAEGIFISLRFYQQFSHDAIGLIVVDAAMILSLFVPFLAQAWLGGLGWSRGVWTIAMHVWQGVWFGVCLAIAFGKEWPWIQSGAFVGHCITMLFKQHSYSSYNIDLRFKHKQLLHLRQLLTEHKKDDDHDSTYPRTRSKTTEDASLTGTDAMIAEIADLEKELIKPNVSFPNNITLWNYIDYLLVPTLVYELSYPRTEKFRPLYFINKAAATLCTFGLLYVSYEHYILPVLLDMPNHTFFDSVFQLMMPFTMCYLLIFFIIFECICNAFAELTCFADREFYEDWWNSSTYDEFARKWNKPVHEFLLRHVYLESISTYKLSKTNATLMTFFLSSCVHELVMFVIGKKLRLYLFGLQMFQVPMIFIARIGWIKKQKLAGNVFFWFGMIFGPPLLAVTYMREHYA
ncbi:hypothetical protein BATDEDRAFT_33345 [Batrachochytrium dendrobatidis JAM81]|uniref:O-acyltransferase n=2 Tax=Batrachochytrium dendrobatidis TaxID=109871 RepID=F4P522_BATDJ|nr:uncharacterized protein BATDEDRAFT_33345 [Batrachochytrium dendrobatidis JAM81]EGF79799.1 hypothetical protein BATDEDRAFT_33345 [Batrachochytrium dendrobatidis JAM81]OAJ39032.1 hypothetical protein BDEG_22910 [Batrachochytrium dendrobatidis JEL423]|eukprot:XP_006679527.1 hypothetical protein BATDEDRAFT_33345 [Batrachochytrium dendrobatidis JAM81]